MKFEHKQELSKFIMILGLVLIAAGFIIIFNQLIPKAYGQNVTKLNATINELDFFLDVPNSVNVFFPIFFLVAVFLFMLASFQYRDNQFAIVFSIAAAVLCVVLTLVFMAPVNFVYTTENTKITSEEIEWLGTNETTFNTSVVKDSTNVVLIGNGDTMRFIYTAIFSVLSIFNGLFAIYVLTGLGKRHR